MLGNSNERVSGTSQLKSNRPLPVEKYGKGLSAKSFGGLQACSMLSTLKNSLKQIRVHFTKVIRKLLRFIHREG